MNHKEVQMMAAEFVLGTLNRAMLLQFRNELAQNPALREAVKDWERRLGMERTSLTLHPRPQDHSKASTKPGSLNSGEITEKDGTGSRSEDGGLTQFDIALGRQARCGQVESNPSGRRSAQILSPPRNEEPATTSAPESAPAAPTPDQVSDFKEKTVDESLDSDRQTPQILRADEGEWESLAPRVYKKLLSRDDSFNRQSYLLRMIPGGRIQPQRRGGIEEIYVLEGRIMIGENSLGPGDFHAFPAKSFVPEISAGGDSLILVRGQIAERIPDPKGTA